MPRLTLIVAATLNNGIGKNGHLPWTLPKEMSYFARTTTNAPEGTANAVLMGRNTWESIPDRFRPLKNRANIVVSRNENYQLTPAPSSANTTAHLHHDLDSALAQLESSELCGRRPIHRTFIIGGSSLYNDTLLLPSSPSSSFVDRILLTRILQPAFEDCDTFLPDFEKIARERGDHHLWRRASHEELEAWIGSKVPKNEEENGVRYEFQMWLR